MALKWPNKDPDEVLDYQIDWTARLATDTITASTWIVPASITKDSDSFTGTATTIWLSAGTNGTSLKITNRIVTAKGRTMEESVNIRITNT